MANVADKTRTLLDYVILFLLLFQFIFNIYVP